MANKEQSTTKKRPSSSSSSKGKADHVIVRNLFALAILRRQLIIALFAIVAATLSLFSAYQVTKVKTPPQYIQLTEDGRIFPIAPLNVESASDGEILNFATESVKWINTYDYKNWRDQLQSQATRFTSQGWENYIQELVNTDNLNTVEAEGLVVSSTIIGEPTVEKKGVVEKANVYTWYVRVPVRISYSSLQNEKNVAKNTIPSQNGVVSLYISRVPLEVNLRGYAIQIYRFEITN